LKLDEHLTYKTLCLSLLHTSYSAFWSPSLPRSKNNFRSLVVELDLYFWPLNMAVSPNHTGIGSIGSYMCDYFIFSLSNKAVGQAFTAIKR